MIERLENHLRTIEKVATADLNDTDFKGIAYNRARNWSRQLMKEGAPGKHSDPAWLDHLADPLRKFILW